MTFMNTNESDVQDESQLNDEEVEETTTDMSTSNMTNSKSVATDALVRNGGLLLTAIMGGVMYVVLENVLSEDKTVVDTYPQAIFAAKTITRSMPALVVCFVVRCVSDNLKSYRHATYVTFIDIGLIWCVAADVIECVATDYQKMSIVGMGIIAHLSFSVAFSSELINANEFPPLRLPIAAAVFAAGFGLLYQFSDGEILTKTDPQVAALVVSFCATTWRAASRIGYGVSDGVSSTAAPLHQWMGLCAAVALTISQIVYLLETDMVKLPILADYGLKVVEDESILKNARLMLYWVFLGFISMSAVLTSS